MPDALRSTKTLIVLLVACATLALAPSTRAASATETLGVYIGAANSSGVAEYGSWLGAQPRYALDFLAPETWTSIGSPDWWLASWSGTPYTIVFSVALIPTAQGGTLAEGAAGAYNDHFRTLAEKLAAGGQGNAILRLGWEFNGGWYPWSVRSTADASNFAAYWRQVVTTMRQVAPGLRFDWNPNVGWSAVNPELAYPGDAYVDFIGLDVYDAGWAPGWQDPVARWNELVNGPYGLAWQRSFAAAHGKAMSYPEWGLWIRDDGHGGGDNQYYIEQMYNWIVANNVAYHLYFEFDAPDGQHALTNGHFPLGAAKFKELFGPGETTTSDSEPAPGGSNSGAGTPGGGPGPEQPGTGSPVIDGSTTPSDTTAPQVLSISPRDGSTGVRNDASVVVTFSEELDAASVGGSGVTLVRVGTGASVSARIWYDAGARRVTIDPTGQLAAGERYAVRIASGPDGLKDKAGNPVATAFSATFTVAQPTTSQGNGGAGAGSSGSGGSGNPTTSSRPSSASRTSTQRASTQRASSSRASRNRGRPVRRASNRPAALVR